METEIVVLEQKFKSQQLELQDLKDKVHIHSTEKCCMMYAVYFHLSLSLHTCTGTV